MDDFQAIFIGEQRTFGVQVLKSSTSQAQLEQGIFFLIFRLVRNPLIDYSNCFKLMKNDKHTHKTLIYLFIFANKSYNLIYSPRMA